MPPVPKPPARARVKAATARQEAKADKAVYDAVTRRDMGCRACGAENGLFHRHHLIGRKFTNTQDVCLVCDTCHELIHVRVGGKALAISGNADVRGTQSRLVGGDGLTVQWRQPDGSWRTEHGR